MKAVVLFAGILIAGVGLGSPPVLGGPPVASARITVSHHVFVDGLGDTLRWESPPQRIVCLSPNITEVLFALGIRGNGEGQRIVGVTRFCDEPPEARDIPQIGGIVDPSLEMIRSVEPDLVVVTRGNPRQFFDALESLEIPRYALETDGGLKALLEGIRQLGHAVGREREADSLVADLMSRVEHLETLTNSLGDDERPRVYYGSLEPPLWTAGPGSMIDDLIHLAGGTNIAHDAPNAWSIFSLETVIAGDPEIYLGTHPEGQREETFRQSARVLTEEAGWRDTEMGRTGWICLIEEDILMRPGPRILLAAEQAARCFHPELFPRDRGVRDQ
jgi:iron complex transport system substrate-binding protein